MLWQMWEGDAAGQRSSRALRQARSSLPGVFWRERKGAELTKERFYLRALVRAMETSDPALARTRLNAAKSWGAYHGLTRAPGRPRKGAKAAATTEPRPLEFSPELKAAMRKAAEKQAAQGDELGA